MNGAFLQAGLVDEISLLLCPAIDGSTGAPSIFEAGEKSLANKLALELVLATQGAASTCHMINGTDRARKNASLPFRPVR